MKTVLVSKRTRNAELISAKAQVYNIVCWYSATTCKTTSGDVWEVVKCSSAKADYLAVK